MSELKIITTSDGSHSLLNTDINETYHSTHGAVQESIHVFIKNGLDFLLKQKQLSEINILEIGFGTGLNVLLSMQHAPLAGKRINYTSLEGFPIDIELAQQLNYPTVLTTPGAVAKFEGLHKMPWNKEVEVQPDFYLTKLKSKLEEAELGSKKFDLVYYDAFAPSKQPEMCTMPILGNVAEAMKHKGVFVTYCAKGQLKRDLKSLGLAVETLEGPPGKKEMVRAVKSGRQ